MKYVHPKEYKGVKFNTERNQIRMRAIVEEYCLKCDLFIGKEHDFSECRMTDKWKDGKVVSLAPVLHGGSGIPDEKVQESIRRGICKVNYATELRIAFTNGVNKYLAEKPDTIDPKKYNKAGMEEVKAFVKEKIRVCGCENKA